MARVPDVRKSMSVRLDDDTHEAINAAAERYGVSAGEYARQAVQARLAWERAMRLISGGTAFGDVVRLCEALTRFADEHGQRPPRS